MITKKLVQDVAKKIDDQVDWVKITGKPLLGRGLEVADNYALPWGLEYLNTKYGSMIPTDYVDEVEAFLNAYIIDDYEGMLKAIPDAATQVINIKWMDDDTEAVWIAANFNAAVSALRHLAEKRLNK